MGKKRIQKLKFRSKPEVSAIVLTSAMAFLGFFKKPVKSTFSTFSFLCIYNFFDIYKKQNVLKVS
jgi:hypothetical protein